jgi:AraC family transcriptional regulator
MLPFSLIELPRDAGSLPLSPYSVGRHAQYHHWRPSGFPVHQIFLTRSGCGWFRDLEAGTETLLEPGMVLVYPPDRGHEYYPLSAEAWHVGFLGFSGSLSQSLLEGDGLLPSASFRPLHFDQCWELIGDIWKMANRQNVERGNNQAAQEMSVTLYRFLLLLRDRETASGVPPKPELETVQGGSLQEAVSLINRHYTEPLLISNIAAAAGYSVQHFQRLFMQEYGVTPHKYLQNLRLQRALQLMKENAEIAVQDIALSLGMETNYFIRMFRGAYGCTPGVMRKKLHESGNLHDR